MKVQQILSTKGSMDVFAIAADATITALVRQLCDKHCGALLITDEAGQIAGIVSERDVIQQLAAGTDLDRVSVGEIMTREPVSISPEEDIHAAMDLMVKRRIRHLPVVSASGPCGLVTVRDLIHAMREADHSDVAKLVDYLQSELETR
ncbi:MAG: CBS domain-containing protein [Kiritimatiellae bacterium]|nr:CBS domain-containing protein [Kiritimatiellia bacterium]